MTPVRMMTMEHFTHRGHPLTYISSNGQYLCNGCRKLGIGNRYRCGTCDFDLHEYCCTCPTLLQSFMHPMHPLTLHVVAIAPGARHTCDVCGTCVDGFFYRCNACNFDAHPLCTQLPQYTPHPLHAHHHLRLQPPGPSSSGSCMVCRTTSRDAWGYTCDVCDFDIHLRCFHLAPAGPVYVHSGSGPGSGSRGWSRYRPVWNLASGFFSGFLNLSSGLSGGGGVDVYSTIVQWAISTWPSG